MPDSPHTMQCMEIWGGNRRISTSVNMPGLDAWVYSRPFNADDGAKSETGGDLHYLSSCATGRITRLVIADVSGHGPGIAAVASSLRRLMCKYTNYIDQSRFVEAVNERFGELQAQGEAFAGLFATAVVATYFAPTDELSLCNAGHPRPLWFDSRSCTWQAVEPAEPSSSTRNPANLPLGVLDATTYTQRAIRLAAPDLVLIYTDPLIELRSAADGKAIGQAGLISLLNTLDPADATTFIPRLLAALAACAGLHPDPSGDVAFDDDLTILLLKRNAAKPRSSPVVAIAASVRIFASAARSLVNRNLPAAFPQLRIDSILGAIADRFNRRV